MESCTEKGATQTKYTPEEPCGYKTQKRTCCGTTWSAWDKDCPDCTCSESTKPDVEQACKIGNSTKDNGKQTRTVECDQDTCSWKKGRWGECKCENSCKGTQIFRESQCECCEPGCYLVEKNGVAGFCGCKNMGSSDFDSASQYCSMTNGQEYRLPGSFSNCTSFANHIGLTAKVMNAYRCSER